MVAFGMTPSSELFADDIVLLGNSEGQLQNRNSQNEDNAKG